MSRGRGISSKQRNALRQKGGKTQGIARLTPGNRALSKRSVRAPKRLGNRNAAIRHSVLRNRAFAGQLRHRSDTRAFARANFRGRFAGKHLASPDWVRFHWRHFHNHIFVIGWIGPVFWPYAYDDFIDYTFYPYGYDTFWPYAYDDVYVSLFGPYAYVNSTYASAKAYRTRGRVQRVPAGGVAQVCTTAASGLTDWPIEQIAEAVEPDDSQQALLTDLKNATAEALALLQSACPSDLPSTPTGRLEAMRTRIETMLKAITIVGPAMDRFYNSLSDEQKARFNALPEGQTARRTRVAGPANLSHGCSSEVAARVPIDRVRKAIDPTQEQAAALKELDEASQRAADLLKANCQADQSLTPPGRIAEMEGRLKTMLKALDLVQPALERFYSTLSDEQKARFNRLPRQG